MGSYRLHLSTFFRILVLRDPVIISLRSLLQKTLPHTPFCLSAALAVRGLEGGVGVVGERKSGVEEGGGGQWCAPKVVEGARLRRAGWKCEGRGIRVLDISGRCNVSVEDFRHARVNVRAVLVRAAV